MDQEMNMAIEQDIHAATVIRLQAAHNALETAAPVLRDAILDLPEIARRLAAVGEGGMAEDVTEMRAKLDTILRLVRAALDIARGARSDVPPELRGGMAPDAAMITRFLEIPAHR